MSEKELKLITMPGSEWNIKRIDAEKLNEIMKVKVVSVNGNPMLTLKSDVDRLKKIGEICKMDIKINGLSKLWKLL